MFIFWGSAMGLLLRCLFLGVFGWVPLHQAKRCLNWYAPKGATALMTAVSQGNIVATRVLLEAGAGATSTALYRTVVRMRRG